MTTQISGTWRVGHLLRSAPRSGHGPRSLNRTFVIGLAVYFTVHAVSRLIFTDGLSHDEAEQAILVESFAWG